MAFGTLWKNNDGQLTKDGTPTSLRGISFFAGPMILSYSQTMYETWLQWIVDRGFNMIRVWPEWFFGLSVEDTYLGVPNTGIHYESSMKNYKMGDRRYSCIWMPYSDITGIDEWGNDAGNPGWYNPNGWYSTNWEVKRNPPTSFDFTKESTCNNLRISNDAHYNLCKAIQIADDFGLAVDVTFWRSAIINRPHGANYYGIDYTGNGDYLYDHWIAKQWCGLTGNYIESSTDSYGNITWSSTDGRNRWKNLFNGTFERLSDTSYWPNQTIRTNWYVDIDNECDSITAQGHQYALSQDLATIKNYSVNQFSGVGWRPLMGASFITGVSKNVNNYSNTQEWWDESNTTQKFWDHNYWDSLGSPQAINNAANNMFNSSGDWTSQRPYGSQTINPTNINFRHDTYGKYLLCQWIANKYVGSELFGGSELDLLLIHTMNSSFSSEAMIGQFNANELNLYRKALDNLPHMPDGTSGFQIPIIANETYRVNAAWHSGWRICGGAGSPSRWDRTHHGLISSNISNRFAGDPNRISAAGSVYHTDMAFGPWKATINPNSPAGDQQGSIYTPEDMLTRGNSWQVLPLDGTYGDIDNWTEIASALLGFIDYQSDWG